MFEVFDDSADIEFQLAKAKWFKLIGEKTLQLYLQVLRIR